MPLILLSSPLNTSVLLNSEHLVSVVVDEAEHSIITMLQGPPIAVTEDVEEISEAILTALGN